MDSAAVAEIVRQELTRSKLASDVRALQSQLGVRAVRTGGVTSAGARNYGSGFTVNRTGVGTYVIVFTPAMPATGVVIQLGSDNGSSLSGSFWTVGSYLGFTANIKNPAGAAVDAFWNFLVVGA